MDALIVAVAGGRPDSVAGWIRCALFAERARRDPEGALATLRSDPALLDHDLWAIRQAWFSTFRGWAEVDPAGAAAGLEEYTMLSERTGQVISPDEFRSNDQYLVHVQWDVEWQQQAFEAVFAQFARADPVAAAEALPGPEPNGLRPWGLRGLFRGVQAEALGPLLDRYESELFADSWVDSMHKWAEELVDEAESEVDAQREFPDEGLRIDVIGLDLLFMRDYAMAHAASAMAQEGPANAYFWLRQSATENDQTDDDVWRLRSGHFYNQLADQNPDGLSALVEPGSHEAALMLAALLRAHSERAAEFLELVPDGAARTGAILLAAEDRSRLERDDLFPAPGRPNRLPNYHERYRSLLDAVGAANLDRQNEQVTRLAIHREFAPVVPEARAAARAMSGK